MHGLGRSATSSYSPGFGKVQAALHDLQSSAPFGLLASASLLVHLFSLLPKSLVRSAAFLFLLCPPLLPLEVGSSGPCSGRALLWAPPPYGLCESYLNLGSWHGHPLFWVPSEAGHPCQSLSEHPVCFQFESLLNSQFLQLSVFGL